MWFYWSSTPDEIPWTHNRILLRLGVCTSTKVKAPNPSSTAAYLLMRWMWTGAAPVSAHLWLGGKKKNVFRLSTIPPWPKREVCKFCYLPLLFTAALTFFVPLMNHAKLYKEKQIVMQKWLENTVYVTVRCLFCSTTRCTEWVTPAAQDWTPRRPKSATCCSERNTTCCRRRPRRRWARLQSDLLCAPHY